MSCSLLIVLASAAFALGGLGLLFGNYTVNDLKFGPFLLVKNTQASSLSGLVKLGLVLLGLIGGVFEMAGIWMMRRLFVLFTRGEFFSRSTARLILWLGVWNMVNAVPFHVSLLLSGLFLLALGWVMELAVALKNEQDLTV